MAYEVTATRRRPQNFDSLIGQEFVAETLKNSISSQKIAHAYLFSGPRGCGKTSTARILAKALNCAEGPAAVPCGKCQQCLEITKGSCTDVIEIDGASNTSVNDVRQIKDEVLFPPQSCRYKIYIIDEVHMLSTSAFNALLKTIEEPPPYVIFIFATTELQKVPATIKSRCQQYNFRLVAIDKVKEQLAQAAAEIGIRAQDEALYWIARESTGSMRDAYTLFDQVAAFSGDEITYEKIRDKLGLVGVDRLNAVFEDCAQNKTQEVLTKIDEFLQAGISIEQLISNSTDYLRSLLLIRNGIGRESLLGQSKDRFSQIVLQRWNSIQIERGLSILLQLYRDIRYSLSPRYELELAFSRLSWLSEYVSPSEVKAAIEKARALLESAPAPAQTQASSVQTGAVQHGSPAANKLDFSAMTPVSAQPPAPKPKMPVFSALQNAAHDSSSDWQDNGAPDTATPENAAPFHDGGAVPPEQTEDDVFADVVSGSDGDSLKKAVITEMSVMSESVLASSLMQTGPWTVSGNTVTAEIGSAFQQKQILGHINTVNEYLSRKGGRPLTFNVTVHQAEQRRIENTPVPDEVKLLVSVFKGNVVGFSQKTEEEKKRNALSSQGSADKESEQTDEEN